MFLFLKVLHHVILFFYFSLFSNKRLFTVTFFSWFSPEPWLQTSQNADTSYNTVFDSLFHFLYMFVLQLNTETNEATGTEKLAPPSL